MQLWYRDPAGGPGGFNLSNGLEVLFYWSPQLSNVTTRPSVVSKAPLLR